MRLASAFTTFRVPRFSKIIFNNYHNFYTAPHYSKYFFSVIPTRLWRQGYRGSQFRDNKNEEKYSHILEMFLINNTTLYMGWMSYSWGRSHLQVDSSNELTSNVLQRSGSNPYFLEPFRHQRSNQLLPRVCRTYYHLCPFTRPKWRAHVSLTKGSNCLVSS